MNERPYVICHIFAALNGHIDGAYLSDPAASASRDAYAQLQGGFDVDAVAYGAVTTKGFVGAQAPALDPCADVPAGDFVAPHAERSYYVSLDPAGEIAWGEATFRRRGRADAHVVEVLTEAAPAAYRAYLRERGISYVLAGAQELDLPLALRRLRAHFGIERLLVCGGGKTDMAFLAAGELDELSLVLAPTVSSEVGVASVFDAMAPGGSDAYAFALAQVERVAGDGVHLVYRVRR